ncbi:MAG: (d)CMP kinase [Coriobacteriaceae bacterium]|nr:(d)CMP kinase [Coriobacteriaceae bacterium]MDD7430429.1 (d)CMP kinase [Coriobacteriaceae bacterium]MDO4499108.1 (d)CMP kinase [Coriobacteriaceae bacterium]MDY3800300.1 (d)CMP kinase [Eggerthellaceae bacterium]MDY4986924.1 (d)CMP kinase [Eggerthellaceae bacterium]
MIIAIDGPSGAGKSTVSKEVASQLGFSCLDTGAMFRAIAWKALECGIDLSDAQAVGKIAREYQIDFQCMEGEVLPSVVTIGGTDVSREIRTSRIDRSVSAVSAHVPVRSAMLEQQRRIGNAGNYVVEGRDIGTVVFPDAELKIFLTASAHERAIRRLAQNRERGVGSLDFDEVLADIERRDELDSSRDTAPLRAADDAVQLDSTSQTIAQIVDSICDLAKKRMGAL